MDYAAMCLSFGREMLPGSSAVFFRPETGAHGVSPKQPGEVFRRKNDGLMHLVVAASKAEYYSQDWLDDMDEFDMKPGWYASYTTVPVVPTPEEAAAITAEKAAKDAEMAAKVAEKERLKAVWAQFETLPRWEKFWPATVAVTWEIHKKEGNDTWKIGTLADGTQVGQVDSRFYDDPRTWFHVPAALLPTLEAELEKENNARKRRDERVKAAQAGTREVRAELRESVWESSAMAAEIAEDVADARNLYFASGEPQDLETLKMTYRAVCRNIQEERLKEYEDALARHSEEIRATLSEKAAKEIFDTFESDTKDYQFIDITENIGKLFAKAKAEADKKAKAAAKAKATRDARKSPMVVVKGNTFPHKDKLKRIAGSKLENRDGKWVWEIPESMVHLLPEGLSV